MFSLRNNITETIRVVKSIAKCAGQDQHGCLLILRERGFKIFNRVRTQNSEVMIMLVLKTSFVLHWNFPSLL